MDKKTLYVFFAVLAIIMFIVFLWSKESVKIRPQPVSQEVNFEQREAQEQNTAIGYTQKIPAAVKNIAGITIIKKPAVDKELSYAAGQADSRKTEKGEELDNAIEKNQGARNADISSEKKQHTGVEGRNVSSANPLAGVTKLNKRPTEKESREMNARGIILY